MTEETTNLVLEHLRHIRSRVDGLSDDMRQVVLRLGSIERHIAGLHVSDVGQNAELDRVKERLDRIERRLELADG
jgi:tetrahydromethanopterin S-methyltransferase subunit G